MEKNRSFTSARRSRLRVLAAWPLVFLALGLLLLPLSLSRAAPNASEERFLVREVTIKGGISPAQSDLLTDALRSARIDGAGLLVVRLDTPGGTVQAMRDMAMTILNAPLPVAVHVAPAGARATSAGVFLVAASHVAVMHPQSTIGAATPVQMDGEDVDQSMAAKIMNDILSFVRSVAQSRGRNVDWYERAVREAESITAQEAALLKVVDFLAEDTMDLLEQASLRGIPFAGQIVRFSPDDAYVEIHEPGFRYSVLSWLLDPQVAYLLLLGGMAGLFFELTSPGAIFPGVLGGLCLLLGLYALSVLPTNVAGLVLLLFGVVLFLLEVHVTSYGLLSVAGVVSLFVGSTILFRAGEGAQVDQMTVIVTVVGMSALLGLAVWLTAKAHHEKPGGGLEGMVGARGVVQRWSGNRGSILVHGELWSAVSADNLEYSAGDVVRVIRAESLTLEVMLEAHTDSGHGPVN